MTSNTAATSWFIWALLSAVFAAMTAIFAKIGLTGIDSDMATLVRVVTGSRSRISTTTGSLRSTHSGCTEL